MSSKKIEAKKIDDHVPRCSKYWGRPMRLRFDDGPEKIANELNFVLGPLGYELEYFGQDKKSKQHIFLLGSPLKNDEEG